MRKRTGFKVDNALVQVPMEWNFQQISIDTLVSATKGCCNSNQSGKNNQSECNL